MAPTKADQVIEELYPSVIGEVIGASLVDFEDTGISLSVLDELKSLWEKNLTDTKVGKFPWDLISVKLEPDSSPTLNPANFQKHRSALPIQEPIPLQHRNVTRLETTVQEQGGLHNPEIALQRAQEHVIQQRHQQVQQQAQPAAVAAQTVLGRIKAASSLPFLPNTYQQQTALNNQSSHPRGPERAPITHPYAGYRPSISYPYPPAPYPYPGPLKQPSLNPPQLDGSSDSPPSGTLLPTITISPPVESAAAVEGEGGGVHNESPNDADDSSSVDEDEDFDEVPELLVCLYDKVWKTRHKAMHKWKCTLRDGVLVVGEKEYVFVKAHAELTW